MMLSTEITVQKAPILASSNQNSENPNLPDIFLKESGVSVLRDKRIVIVEDEGITQLQLKKICQLAGMLVVGTARDGEVGVQMVLETLPDIVLVDIKMPGMSGLEAADIILRQHAACVIMLTAYDLEDYKTRATVLGTCGYILKPVTAGSLIPQLEAAYRQYLGQAQ